MPPHADQARDHRAAPWAVAALAFNALVWGVSWWPFRLLQDEGWHPLVSTALVYALCTLVLVVARPAIARAWLRSPALWLISIAAGTTNAAFNWAVTVGDVVRVVLLFYLMPVWAVLLARVLLGERLSTSALLRVVVAMVGAGVVLLADHATMPTTPTTTAAPAWQTWMGVSWIDALALLGGFSFALNNVLLRREAHSSSAAARTAAMFVGGALLAGLMGWQLGVWPSASQMVGVLGPSAWPLVGVLALGLMFMLGNAALQFGAARLPAQTTAVVMLLEVLFASLSAVLLGGTELGPSTLVGGALIMAAALLATREARS